MNNEITETFLGGWWIPILTFLIVGIVFTILVNKKVESSPTILTTLGILMTFIGIALSLTTFDVIDIEQSIPKLISGMSFAFYSSIWGMSFGLLSKYILRERTLTATGDARSLTVETFYDLIKSQSDTQIKINDLLIVMSSNSEATKSGIKDLHDRIELQHSREMELSKEQHNQQIEEFKEFAQRVSEIGSKQLIEALESVIRDFNTQLNEQFGENFKQLNEAVFKLVEWQEEYRRQLIDLKEQYDNSLQAIQGIDSSFVSIKDSCSEIPATMEKVKDFTTVAQHQLKDLDSYLTAFAELKENAKSAIPEIKAALDEIFKSVQEGVEEATSHHSILLEKSELMAQNYVEATQASIEKYSEQQQTIFTKQALVFDGFVEHAESAQNEIIEQTKIRIQALVDNINDSSREQFDRLKQSAEKISKINETLDSVTNGINTESMKLQNALKGQVDALIEDIKQSAIQIQQEQVQLIKNIFNGVENQLESSLKATQEVVQKEVNLVEKALESEISQAMTALARSLAGITEHMSNEYQRMIEVSKVINKQD